MSDTPVFDVDSLINPTADFIIGGETLHSTSWGKLSLIERRRLDRNYRRIDEIEDLETPSKKQQEEYEAVMVETLTKIGLPPDAIPTLDFDQRKDVLSAFLALRLVRSSAQSKTLATGIAQQTTAKSSPGSTSAGRKGTRKRG